MNLVIDNFEKHQHKEVALKIEPGKTEEIGWLEGWSFLPGETMTMSHPDYQSETVQIPP